MHFDPDQVYHVYNRGNNKGPIFFEERNYSFILKKVENEWLKFCEVMCYCLMPNHFHFMIMAHETGCEEIIIKDRLTHLQQLSKVIGKTLSSYTQAINIQNKTTGNLFQRKTKAKCLSDLPYGPSLYTVTDYLKNCFHYIHFNPRKARLVDDLLDWPFSSWQDYAGYRNNGICNVKKTLDIMDTTMESIQKQNDFVFQNYVINDIW